jgi:hypothetical protein
MNKKTKMYVGLGVVAVAAYYFYMQSKKKETAVAPAKFVGATGMKGGLNKVGTVEKL